MQLCFETCLPTEPDRLADPLKSYLDSLGYRLERDEGEVLIFRRGHRWAGLYSYDMGSLLTDLVVQLSETPTGGTEVTFNYDICNLGQHFTSTNKDYWRVEFEQAGHFLQHGHVDAQRAALYRKRAWINGAVWTVAWVAITWIVMGLAGVFLSWSLLLGTAFLIAAMAVAARIIWPPAAVPAQYLPTATEAVEPSLERLSTGVGEELQEETVEVREGFRE